MMAELRRIKRVKLWGHWLQGWRESAKQEPPRFALEEAVTVIDALEGQPTETANKAAQEEGRKAAHKLEDL